MAETIGLSFAALTPDTILSAVEDHTGLFLDGSITPYNSYVNRVFGVVDEDENQYIVKFYRPGRWTRDAILEEHAFLADCRTTEIPIIAPIPGSKTDGGTLGEYRGFLFAVFNRVRARSFEITGDEDWIRTGRVLGRLHCAGRIRKAPGRLRLTPGETTARYIADILEAKLVHPDCMEEFSSVCAEALSIITPLFDALPPDSLHRIHGDCHRGNILSRPDGDASILTLIDFDDMMTGPAVQDLWLLLPGHLEDSIPEMNLLLEGYREFCDFDPRTLCLVEPLRFMRHIYFLNWCATQRDDTGFAARYPLWGGKAFWIAETEDLQAQLNWIAQRTTNGTH